jgi:hypothetical protein
VVFDDEVCISHKGDKLKELCADKLQQMNMYYTEGDLTLLFQAMDGASNAIAPTHFIAQNMICMLSAQTASPACINRAQVARLLLSLEQISADQVIGP